MHLDRYISVKGHLHGMRLRPGSLRRVHIIRPLDTPAQEA
jgi:hypothetical protein